MIDPTTGEEQVNPLESMIESTILQNESMKEQGQETNALLEALVMQNNSVEPLLEAQIIQSQKNNKELKEALKESTFNFQIDGVEMASITGPQGEKGEKGDKGDDGTVSLEMPDGTIERKEGKIVVKGLKGDKGDKGEQGEKGESGKDGVDGKVIFGANGRNGLDGIDGKDGVDGANGRDGSPDTPKQIKKKLESLKDDERLDVKAIKGIKDFQKQLDRVAGFASQGQEYRISGTKIANNSGVLNFVAGSGATITGVPTSDGATITIGASGGGGAVDSVNGQIGVVVLDTGDIAEATDANYVSDAQLVVIGNTSGTNTGDQNLSGYELLSNKSTSTSLGTSDTLYPTQNAVKTYADNLIVGLLDYRGAYDASVNTFPTSGGSGTAGAVLKGDMWVISVAGTLGGTAVQVGDSLIANIDTPGQTAANWNILNGNISYVPEDVANKVTSLSGASTDTQYPSAKLTYDQLATKQPLDADLTTIAGLTATTNNFIQSKSSAWASRTPAQVTADLSAMVGDSGSGGTKGLVPAPASGDAAAGKFLKADGTWATTGAGGGTVTSVTSANSDATVETTTTTPVITIVSAPILSTARTIGGVSFNGSSNIVPQTIQSVNEATDTTCFPLFISASGTQSLQPLNNAGFTYNSNTNALTATTFIGALTGNASTATTATTATGTNALYSATTTVNVNSATAPSSGQVLTATSSTAATWQTPSTGGYSLLASVDLSGGAASSLASGTFTAKKNIRVIVYWGTTSSTAVTMRLNADSGANYKGNIANNFVGDGAYTSGTSIKLGTVNGTIGYFGIIDFYNVSTIAKKFHGRLTQDEDALIDTWGLWNNTSSQITAVSIAAGSGNLPTDTTLKVYGMD